MYKKNQGHGICGAKNIYSSNVKLGNWVEDTVGLQLTQQEIPVHKNYMSNTSLSYKDPKDQPPLPSMPVNMPTTQELKAKNKEGMQYSLIFDHGLKEIPPEVCIYPLHWAHVLLNVASSTKLILIQSILGAVGNDEHADNHEEEKR